MRSKSKGIRDLDFRLQILARRATKDSSAPKTTTKPEENKIYATSASGPRAPGPCATRQSSAAGANRQVRDAANHDKQAHTVDRDRTLKAPTTGT